MIAVDIHDVLADYVMGMIFQYGEPRSWEPPLEAMFPGMDPETHFEEKRHNDFLAKLPSIPDAATALWRLKYLGIPFVYSSAGRESSRDVTIDWFTRHGFPRAPLILHGSNEVKIAWTKDPTMGLVAIIDDRAEVLEAAMDSGITAYVFDRPWNRSINTGRRLLNWLHAITRIERDFMLESWSLKTVGD